ncbi:hypothetical protein B0G93_101348 [Bacillus sp. V-88]|uniref:hypothetical protein n=1 Tax=Rossellomorea vietnamensis TaxID=218284 RepID=UPI000558F048|nr:hypothetical protein [Rossellomorea vietnamensis]OXS64450.1 hypothetical protein B1B00_01615 [Bacillus sp. DSM 27956]PRX79598.1 hypothetical protein B0G93_101348 [Bacillus sp. V-88]SLJ99175.1 hypothetical protein SAMN06295884_101348 [Bacillus sp. V-88]
MKYLKSFLAFEWITLIGASIVLYTRWNLPLYICIGIVIMGVILTLYFTKKYEPKEKKAEDL